MLWVRGACEVRGPYAHPPTGYFVKFVDFNKDFKSDLFCFYHVCIANCVPML